MKSAEYWKKRSIQRLTRAERSSVSYLRDIRKIYQNSARSVVQTVKETYASYYRNDKTFSLDKLEEIEPSGNITRLMSDMEKAGLKTSLPDNFKGRMSRLEAIEAQLWAEAKKAGLQEKAISTESYKKTITDTYYHTIFDVSKGVGATPAFSTLNSGTINAILNSNFKGANYSERIWDNTDKLADSLKDILARAIATGQAPEKTIREVMERFGVARSNASRLVRTETNYFENRAELASYKELGIEKFKFLATLDERTSDICRSMDGKEFSVKEAKQGGNAPPLHPYCRSTIVPVVEGWEPEERFARDPRTDENGTIPLTNYKEWSEATGISGVNEGAKGDRTNIAWRLGETHMAAMNKILNARRKSAETQLFRAFEDKVKVVDPLYHGRSHFSPQTQGVYVNIARDSMTTIDSVPYRTTFHELGHNIDYLAGNGQMFSSLFEDGAFYATLKREYNALVEARAAMVGGKGAAYQSLRREILRIKRSEQSYVSDIFSGVSKNKVHGLAGHESAYWSDPRNIAAESFTQMYSATITSEGGLAAIKRYFPESYSLYRRMIKTMKGGKI